MADQMIEQAHEFTRPSTGSARFGVIAHACPIV